MNEVQQKPPIFWPVVFLTAFGFGAVLWGVWMVKFVIQTRAAQSQHFSPPTMGVQPQRSQNDSTVAPVAPESAGKAMAKTNGMIWIPGGTFWMGSADGRTDEQPVHQVTV